MKARNPLQDKELSTKKAAAARTASKTTLPKRITLRKRLANWLDPQRTRPRTPEDHADALMTEIEYELNRWGVESLAAVCATMLENEDAIPEWRTAARAFRRIEEQRP